MQNPILVMLVAMSLIPLGDSAGKLLVSGHAISPFFLAFTRFAIGAVCIAPFISRRAWALFGNWRIWLRGALISGGITSILMALRTEPLPNVFGAFFVGPIISYLLSWLWLKEQATPLRSLLLGVGFVGVLCIVQPSVTMSSGIFFAVLAGCFYGAFLTASRWLSHLAKPPALLFSQMLVAGLITAPLGLMFIPPMPPTVIGLSLVSALCSMLGNLLLIVAYARAPATRMAPLVYFQLIAAMIFGYLIFADIPNPLALVGLALLVVSGFASLLLRR